MPGRVDTPAFRSAIEAGDATLETEGAGIAAPWSLKLVVATTFLPEGLSFFLFDLRLTATRVILLLLTPVLVMRAGQLLASGRYRFVLSDLLVPLAGVWMFLAPAQVVGTDLALRHSGPIALEFCIAYLATRILLAEHGQALSLATTLCGVITIVALLGLLDPLTGTYVVRQLVGSLTGHWRLCDGPGCFRYGLLRATGPMEQTILYALACGIGLLLASGAEIRWRRLTIVLCTLGLIFSFSAGPALGVVFGFGLLLYDRILAGLDRRWSALALTAAVGLGLLFTLNSSPSGFIIRHFTFEPDSGYYRLYVWHVAGARILQSPWFGVGFSDWDQVASALGLSTSVDSLWLVSGLTFGIPGSALIALAMLGSVSFPISEAAPGLPFAEAKLARTLSILIFVVVFVGFTVHLWGSDWILCGLLAGTSAHLAELGRR
jgi:hypothetical protein